MYCGKTPKDNKIKLVVDHIIPVVRGGAGDFANLITACERCNLEKGTAPLPVQLVFDFWDYSKGEFSYKEIRDLWERNTTERRLKASEGQEFKESPDNE